MKEYIASYRCSGVCDHLFLKDGCLGLDSAVWGDWDSESHYSLDEASTKKLLDAVGGVENLKEIFEGDIMCGKFADLCRKHGVHYDIIGF